MVVQRGRFVNGKKASPLGQRCRGCFAVHTPGFPLGGSCQRPRPLTDEGRTCRYDPYMGCRGELSPSSGPAGPPSPSGEGFGAGFLRWICYNVGNGQFVGAASLTPRSRAKGAHYAICQLWSDRSENFPAGLRGYPDPAHRPARHAGAVDCCPQGRRQLHRHSARLHSQ